MSYYMKSDEWLMDDQIWFIDKTKLFTIPTDKVNKKGSEEETEDFKNSKYGQEGDSEWFDINPKKVTSNKKFTYIEYSGPFEDNVIKLLNKNKYK